jgi:hypothetical protein
MFARAVLRLHTVPLSVPKIPTSKSCGSITSKLIETKALQVPYSGHVRKTGGRGSYRLIHPAHCPVQRGLAVKSCYSRTYGNPLGWGIYRFSCQTNSPAIAQSPLPHLLPRADERQCGRWPQGAPAMLQFARSGPQHCGKQRLGLVEGEGNAKEVGAAGVGVFFVAGGSRRGEVCEDVPGRVFGEEFFCGGVLASDLYYYALRAAADFEEDGADLSGVEGA